MRPGERLAHRLAEPGLSQPVRVGRALDLDHLGAQIAEQPAQFAAGDDDAEVDDPQPVEWHAAGFPVGPRRLAGPASHRASWWPVGGAGARNPVCRAVDGEIAGRDAGVHARERARRRQWRPPPGNDRTTGSARDPARRRSARRATARPPPGLSWSGRRTTAQPARRSRAMPQSGRRSRRIRGPGTRSGSPSQAPQPVPLPRRHHAEPDVAVVAGEDRVGVLVPRSAAPPFGRRTAAAACPCVPNGGSSVVTTASNREKSM